MKVTSPVTPLLPYISVGKAGCIGVMHQVIRCPNTKAARANLIKFIKANADSVDQLEAAVSTQENEYRAAKPDINERIMAQQLKSIEEGRQRSFFNPELLMGTQETLEARAGAGRGLILYSLVHLEAWENASTRRYMFSHHERPPFYFPLLKQSAHQSSLPQLADTLHNKMTDLHKAYYGATIVIVPFTIEEKIELKLEDEARFHALLNYYAAAQSGISEFFRRLAGVSITKTPEDAKVTAFTEQEARQFIALMSRKRVIDV
jgi:hypothetical protein